MRQVVQNLKTGVVEVAELPAPALRPGHVLVQTRLSLVSAGTERATIAAGRASLIERARRQPEKVVEMLGRVRRDGFARTVETIQAAFERLQPLGYCSVGTVLQVGQGVDALRPGQRVACNGPHAELAVVPVTLCAAVPDAVSDEAAAFTVLGAVALQGIRLAAPTLGECFAVVGLGVVGLLAVQLLRAQGVRVLAIDPVPERQALARDLGAEAVAPDAALAAAQAFSRQRGIDGVLLATATESSEPLHQAALMCRKRGRVVLIGTAGLEIARADFYEKELSFQVSAAYGPGRYDRAYEEQGRDYPAAYVRWTAGRNFEAVLDLLAERRLAVEALASARFPVDQAEAAYRLVDAGGATLGVLFEYGSAPSPARRVATSGAEPSRLPAKAAVGIGLIGAGSYAASVLAPAIHAGGGRLLTVAARGGADAVALARRFGAAAAASDADAVLADPAVDAVVIATRHDSHAALAAAALAAGKHVFVEKPLALSVDEADAVAAAHARAGDRLLMVGFNRRFAPLTLRVQSLLAGLPGPRSVLVTVNAGAVPAQHWTRDPMVGGGRIVGEACHFVDLIIALMGGEAPASVAALPAGEDGLSAVLGFADGSTGTLNYLSNGHRDFPKERIEVFCAGRVLRIDDFRRLDGFGIAGQRGTRQDKGNAACMQRFIAAVKQGGPPPVPFAELMVSTRATLDLAAAARRG